MKFIVFYTYPWLDHRIPVWDESRYPRPHEDAVMEQVICRIHEGYYHEGEVWTELGSDHYLIDANWNNCQCKVHDVVAQRWVINFQDFQHLIDFIDQCQHPVIIETVNVRYNFPTIEIYDNYRE